MVLLVLAAGIVFALFSTANGQDHFDYTSKNIVVKNVEYVRTSRELNMQREAERRQISLINKRDLFLGGSLPLMLLTNAIQSWIKDQTSHLTPQCKQDLNQFYLGLENKQLWAIQMLDSFGKLPSGILEGNPASPGNYDQCIQPTQLPKINFTIKKTFETHYCWLSYNLQQNALVTMNSIPVSEFNTSLLKFKLAICMPDTCTEKELTKILKSTPIENFISLSNINCLAKDISLWKDGGAVAAFIICCIIATLMLIGTVLDLYKDQNRSKFMYSKLSCSELTLNHTNDLEKQQSTIEKTIDESEFSSNSVKQKKGLVASILLSFSVYTNGSKLMKLSAGKESIPSINGIRFISMTWIILVHTMTSAVDTERVPVDNLLSIWNHKKDFIFRSFIKAFLVPDTFFTISGLLTAYTLLNAHKANGNISWIKFYIHRYWRLTPPYLLFMILIYMKLSGYLSSGPFWPSDGFGGECKTTWWKNAIYINNIGENSNCMPWTWFLANDMQFYCLSPLILIPLIKRKMILTWLIAGILILTSTTCFAALMISRNFSDPMYMEDMTELKNFHFGAIGSVVNKPYTRMASYVIGIIFGWYLYEHREQKLYKTVWIITGWSMTIITSFYIFICHQYVYMSPKIEAIYLALCTCAWPACVCWIIFACVKGYGGIANHILSWPVWNPLGRLTYMAYIWHFLALKMYFANSNKLPSFSYSSIIITHIGITTVTYIGAAALSLAFEVPLLELEKNVFQRSSTQMAKAKTLQ